MIAVSTRTWQVSGNDKQFDPKGQYKLLVLGDKTTDHEIHQMAGQLAAAWTAADEPAIVKWISKNPQRVTVERGAVIELPGTTGGDDQENRPFLYLRSLGKWELRQRWGGPRITLYPLPGKRYLLVPDTSTAA